MSLQLNLLGANCVHNMGLYFNSEAHMCVLAITPNAISMLSQSEATQ